MAIAYVMDSSQMISRDDMRTDRFAQDEDMALAHRVMFFRIAALDAQTMRETIN